MKLKKILATALACTLVTGALGSFSGCGSDKDTLYISVVNVGYGANWLHQLVEGYKAHNPEAKIEVDDTYVGGRDKGFLSELESGESDTDIYFSRNPMYKYMEESGWLTDLTDFYTAANPYDSGKTVASKLHPDIMRDISMKLGDGKVHQFTVPWVQDCLGLLYNETIFSHFGFALPNTTNELIALAQTIKNTPWSGSEAENGKLMPFVDSGDNSYWSILVEDFITQYEGSEAMQGEFGFWNGYDPDGERYTSNILSYDGILEAYEVIHDLISLENGFVHPDSMDLTFTQAQSYLINTEYGVCMQPNGAWIQREMEGDYSASQVKLKMMQTPIISSIVNKLEYRNNGAKMTDEMLSDVISAIDGGATTYSGVSQNDMKRLIETRNTMFSWTAGHIGYIPSYSNKQDMAKDFLYYLTSDEGQRIFTKATNGCTQPYGYDYLADNETAGAMNDFMKSIYNRVKGSNQFMFEIAKDPLFRYGGVTLSYNWEGTTMLQAFEADPTEKNTLYMTPYDFFTYRKNLYARKWGTILQNAGLSNYGG